MKSLHGRLVAGITLLVSLVWMAAAVWHVRGVQAELTRALDARLASSAHMVQGLIQRGEVHLAEPGEAERDGELTLAREGEIQCQLWSLDGRLLATDDAGGEGGLEQADGHGSRSVQGELWRTYVLTDRERGLRIMTAERQQVRTALMAEVARAVSVPFLLVLPLVALLVWAGVRHGLVPLERLRRLLTARRPDALEPLPVTDLPAELMPLATALNELLARLEEVLQRERRFTGDAAHELRTPLAGIKSHLQIAQATAGADRDRALARAEQGIDRMTRLVAQLLELARLEASPRRPSESCPARAVAEAVVQEYLPRARQQQVALIHRVDPALVVPLPAAMLHSALGNLVENALRHSPAGGRVVLSGRAGPEGMALCVTDEGPGMTEAQRRRASQRFYRGPDQPAPGSGLGLAIVDALARHHGLRLTLASRPDRPGLQACLSSSSSDAAPTPMPE